MQAFEKSISEIRKKLRLTQSQFAELVNLSEDSVGKLERGISKPNIETLYKISEGLKMPVSEILGEKGSPRQKNKNLDDFVSYLKTKSTQEIALLHEIAVLVLERGRR